MLQKSDPKILATPAESRNSADKGIREIRTISYLLHPPLLEDTLELALFPIVLEGPTNAHHLSGGKSARVQIRITSSQVIFQIRDRGKGLPADIWKPEGEILKALGVGIASMGERDKEAGGTLEFDSRRLGTTLGAALPLVKK